MKTVGRFVVRPEGDGRGNLILGAMFRDQGDVLKPNRVYEISETMGELIVKDVGPSAIDARRDSLLVVGWENNVDLILDCGKEFVLTRNEYEALCAGGSLAAGEDGEPAG